MNTSRLPTHTKTSFFVDLKSHISNKKYCLKNCHIIIQYAIYHHNPISICIIPLACEKMRRHTDVQWLEVIIKVYIMTWKAISSICSCMRIYQAQIIEVQQSFVSVVLRVWVSLHGFFVSLLLQWWQTCIQIKRQSTLM